MKMLQKQNIESNINNAWCAYYVYTGCIRVYYYIHNLHYTNVFYRHLARL